MVEEAIYLTPQEAASYLRTSPSTLAKRRARGYPPVFCRMGRSVRYRKTDLDRWLDGRRVDVRTEQEVVPCR